MPQVDPSTLTSRDNGAITGGHSVLDKLLVGSESARRWDWSDIDESLWSQSWPYQLAVVEAQDDGTYVQKDTFTLPINPESLTNSMPFATTLQATFGGVIENNGGVPLRPIALTGNLGVVNDRESGEALGGLLFQLGGVLGGTIQAGQQLVASAQDVGKPQFDANLYPATDTTRGASGVPERSTGYFQWLYFQRFLESYAEAKKTEDGATLRLALYVWKEQAAWLISPEVLQLNRTSAQPVEYQYNFRATAYARLNPKDIRATDLIGGAGRLPVTTMGARSQLSNALNTIQRARRTIDRFQNLAKAINADFEAVGQTIRSVALGLKDAVGAVKTWADFPATIKNTAYRIINENSPIFKNLLKGGSSSAPSSQARMVSVAVDTASIDDQPTDSLRNPPLELRRAMSAEVARVRGYTTDDFRTARQQVETFRALFAAKVGLPDPRTTNPPAPIRQATDDDYAFLGAMVEVADAISQALVVQKRTAPPSLLDYVAGLASTAGIEMRRAQSKFAVPFPYGATLETVALQYLGDASRWGEIAALNELRQPYIDETGQDQLLLANGNGHNIVVADGSQLQVDHYVTISSNLVFQESRRVLAINELAPNYWTITLGGAGDLAKFKVGARARIHYFLPGTVNSQKVIFIPSQQATTNTDLQLRYVPSLSDLETILQVGGVDGALTDAGDIAITQDGDWPYVQGLAALIQWARIALNTPLKSWLLYPTFGIDMQVGQSLADMSAADVLTSIKTSFALNDAFTGVQSALVETNGPATRVTLELRVKGVDSTLPVSFEVAQ